MVRLLQWLFLGHVHKWKTLEKHRLELFDWSTKQSTRTGDRYIQQCESCGIVKKRDLA